MKKNMFFTIIAAIVLMSCAKTQPYIIKPTPENLTAVPAEGSVQLTRIVSMDAGNIGGYVQLPGNNGTVYMKTVVGPIVGTQYLGQIGTGVSMYPLARGLNVRYESDGLLHVDGFYFPHGMNASTGKSWILRAQYVYGPGGTPVFGKPQLIEVSGDWSKTPDTDPWCKMPWVSGVSFCTTTVSTSNSGLRYTITP